MPREAIDQFRQRIMDGNPQELLARYRGDEIFNQLVEQHQIGTNPDGSPQIVLTLNEAGVSTLLEGLAPSALLANHSDSQFLRDMFGSVPELARTYQQFEQFEGNLREIEQDIENEIVRLGQKYNFPENVNTLPSPAREQESLRIATILCRELANRNQYQYDQIYANNNEYMAIPAKYQRTYEEGLVANQKRGMCTSFSSFYQHALEHYGVSSVLLNGTRLNLFGSSDGDSPSIASRHAFVGVRVSGDSENPIYHIFDPTQGRYGEGTSDYSYYVEPSAYTYASSMLRGAFTGGYQQYHRLSARQAFLKTISGTSIDRDIIDQIK